MERNVTDEELVEYYKKIALDSNRDITEETIRTNLKNPETKKEMVRIYHKDKELD